MAYGLKIVGWADGRPCPMSGEWIESYDPNVCANPERPTYPTGNGSSTDDAAKALRFPDAVEAMVFWKQESTVVPLRPDGQPNRPLTAFTVVAEPLPEGESDA